MGSHWSGPRIPLEVEGLQVNFCKNPRCLNFGVPPSLERQPRGKTTAKRKKDTYVRNQKRGTPTIRCQRCSRTSSLKSNQGVVEELRRLTAGLQLPRLNDRCPNPDCENKTPIDEWPFTNYQRFGTTRKGADRFRCKLCKKTFSIPYPPTQSPHARQKVHGFKNIEIFKELVNHVALSRICRLRELPFKLLIDRIRFIYGQCRLFNADREVGIRDLEFDDIYLSVDRQVYMVNWSHATDRRNTALMAIASAERYSGYIFGLHLNFDPTLDANAINQEAIVSGDAKVPLPFRRFARLWLPIDYEAKDTDNEDSKDSEEVTASAVAAADVELDGGDAPNIERQLPKKGLQIRAEYTMYAHFLYLKSLLPGVKRFVFYMDDESGIDAALFAAFTQEVEEKRCEGFVVKINKELTVNQKRQEKRKGDRKLAEYLDLNPYLEPLTRRDQQQFYLKESIEAGMTGGILHNKTIDYPFPNMSEPQKQVRWVSDLEDRALDADQIATLYRRATLHPVDRFFMQIRRGVTALERSMFTASSGGRVWHAYAPYDPERVVWLLEIYRTAYNYIFVGRDRKTPAMRLGLAKGPLKYEDILYFIPPWR